MVVLLYPRLSWPEDFVLSCSCHELPRYLNVHVVDGGLSHDVVRELEAHIWGLRQRDRENQISYDCFWLSKSWQKEGIGTGSYGTERIQYISCTVYPSKGGYQGAPPFLSWPMFLWYGHWNALGDTPLWVCLIQSSFFTTRGVKGYMLLLIS